MSRESILAQEARTAERIRSGFDQVAGVFKEKACLLYTSPSPRDRQKSRMPSSA